MEGGGDGGGNLLVNGRTTIDTRRPFQSVKEAVSLFGEVVLAGEIYAASKKFTKETPTKPTSGQKPQIRYKVEPAKTTVTELEDTKRSLERAREEGELMSSCIDSLRKELEQARRELQRVKTTRTPGINLVHDELSTAINPEIEEIKFVESNNNATRKEQPSYGQQYSHRGGYSYEGERQRGRLDEHIPDIRRKSVVRFASPPSLIREIKEEDKKAAPMPRSTTTTVLGRAASFRKDHGQVAQKKGSVSFVGWLFPKKKKIPALKQTAGGNF